ncbi:hypothetical protein M378DRAFT_16380 [Amanita muscaria Koide BX008]|uniref:Uncharacterized protein n=1 Tax=Amanita muscaria (strain Koide BX008) TaxID=946122 RepID=A0A0C2WKL7_AMAMK|nr:hypothetical protein M378DRAFT_16380 [Amanita muscaria Koide BX008]
MPSAGHGLGPLFRTFVHVKRQERQECQEDHSGQTPSRGDPNSDGLAVQSGTNREPATRRPRRQPTAPKETGPLALRNEESALTEWLKNSYNCLLDGEEDSESVWSACIKKWLEFEKGLPLANLSSGRLPATKQRPRELSQWLARRDFSKLPQIANISIYVESLNSWWADLQVARSKGQADDSLQHLRKGGPNGIVTLMFGLRWWQLNMDQQNSIQWNAMVEQVREMLENFVRNPAKRKSDSQSDKGNTKRRKL